MTELDPNVCPLARWQKHLRAIPQLRPPPALEGGTPGSWAPPRIAGPARVSIGTSLVAHGWRWPGMAVPSRAGAYAVAPAEVPQVRALVDAAMRHHAGTPLDPGHHRN